MERIGLDPGVELGGYRVLSALGTGGSGTVYRAMDGAGNLVALKLLHRDLDAHPQARLRLADEVAALQRVRSPYVAPILDAELDSDHAFIITELVDAPSLRDEVRAAGAFSPDELLPFAQALFDAVQAVHTAGVLHRDLSPGNVLVTAEGPILIDFGIAKTEDAAAMTQTGTITGTPGFIAPEILAGEQASETTDWWAWAAVVAFAALGRSPFGSGTTTEVLSRVQAGRMDAVGLSQTTAQALAKALNPDRRARLSPVGLIGELERALEEPGDVIGVERTAVLPAGAAGATVDTAGQGIVPPPMPDTVPAPPPADADTTVQYPPQQAPWDANPVVAPWETAVVGDGHMVEEDDYARPARRPGTPLVVAAAATLTLSMGMWPGVTLIAIAAMFLVLRAVGEGRRSLVARREVYGPRPSDTWLGIALAPWHFIKGLVLALPSLLVALSAGFMVWGLGWYLLQQSPEGLPGLPGAPAVEADAVQPWAEVTLMAIAATVILLLGWYGPGASWTRIGGRVTAQQLRRIPGSVIIAGLFVIAAISLLVWQMLQGSIPVWAPLGEPPTIGS